MKKSTIFILGLLVSALVFAQSETRSLAKFDEVSVGESIEVHLIKGTKESAKVVVDNVDIEEVITEVSGGTLKIFLEGNYYRNVDVEIYLTYVTLEGLKSSSSSSIDGGGLIVADDEFEIRCSSSGSIDVSVKAKYVDVDISSSGEVNLEVEADEMEVEVSSSGELNVDGSTDKIEVAASSSGEVDGYDLVCQDAELRSSSGASIKLTVNGELEARASSGSSIRYSGKPTYTDVDTSSGGSVRRS